MRRLDASTSPVESVQTTGQGRLSGIYDRSMLVRFVSFRLVSLAGAPRKSSDQATPKGRGEAVVSSRTHGTRNSYLALAEGRYLLKSSGKIQAKTPQEVKKQLRGKILPEK